VAGRVGNGMRGAAAGLTDRIRTDAVWMSVVPIDMQAGTDTLLARIVVVIGEARPHHAYLFANHRGTRMEVPGHEGPMKDLTWVPIFRWRRVR